MNRRKFIEGATLAGGSLLAVGSVAKSAVAQTSAGGLMAGDNPATRAQELHDIKAILDRPDVAKLVSNAATEEANPNATGHCSACCILLGGGGAKNG